MSDTNERLIRIFEDLAVVLRQKAKKPASHDFPIEDAARYDTAVRHKRERLIYLRDVRNTLQHPKHQSDGPAVTVSEAFLQEAEQLLTYIRNPPTASSVAVPRGKIRVAGLDETLGTLATAMHEHGFSHLPILNEQGAVIGVFNEASLLAHFRAQGGAALTTCMHLREIQDDCRLGDDRTEVFQFVRPNAPFDDLIEKFLALPSPRSRVGAIFVTASGRSADALTGLITPWDVLMSRRT